MKSYYKCEVTKNSEQDLYNEGCLPDTFQDFGIVQTLVGTSIQGLMKKIKEHYGDNFAEFESLDGEKPYIQLHEDEHGVEANQTRLSNWRRGDEKLWSVTYMFFISAVTITEIANEDIFDALYKNEVQS